MINSITTSSITSIDMIDTRSMPRDVRPSIESIIKPVHDPRGV